MKLPFGAGSSGLNRARQAGEALSNIASDRFEELQRADENFNDKSKSNNSNGTSENETMALKFCRCPWKSHSSKLDHAALLLTALVPKAAASLITSLFLSSTSWTEKGVSTHELSDMDSPQMNAILNECARMWPPFFGGRRIAKRDTTLDGYVIPAGRSVVYVTHAAHRDPSIFENPDVFDHTRWMGSKQVSTPDWEIDERLFMFGGGQRNCPGAQFIMTMIKYVIAQFHHRYNWCFASIPSDQMKWLPVCRPKIKPQLLLSYRSQTKNGDELN